MSLSRRKFTKEFKRAAVRRLEVGASLAEVARACEVNPNVLHRWRREFRDGVDRAFPGLGKRKAEDSRTAELERKIGQQTLEIDFLKSVLQRVEEARMLQALHSTAPSSQKSAKQPPIKRSARYARSTPSLHGVVFAILGPGRAKQNRHCCPPSLGAALITKQFILSLPGYEDCFAEPVIGRAFARPVGSQ